MNYVLFSVWFMVIHAAAYTGAGVIALAISKDIYKGKARIMDYLRDMNDPEDNAYVTKRFFPAQLLRGLLMSIVLYPVLEHLGSLSPVLRILFFFGLTFIYTHIGSAAPCPDNIEGYVYMKKRYENRALFWRFQLEMTMYSLLVSFASGLLLF